MGKPSRSRQRRRLPRFHSSEIEKMQKLICDKDVKLFDQSFCQELTEKFNLEPGRAGSKPIHWQQVERWLHDGKNIQTSKSPVMPSDPKEQSSVPENFSESLKESSNLGEKDFDGSDLAFEAKSSTDGAWYDISSFLQHRRLTSGEAEVRVRFRGFGPEEDEWVNVEKAVRQRSVPLESSECLRVVAGDPILCFRESGHDAAYFDAHVVEIRRRQHDIRGCRCLFTVRYDHDEYEETVRLSKVCCWKLR